MYAYLLQGAPNHSVHLMVNGLEIEGKSKINNFKYETNFVSYCSSLIQDNVSAYQLTKQVKLMTKYQYKLTNNLPGISMFLNN